MRIFKISVVVITLSAAAAYLILKPSCSSSDLVLHWPVAGEPYKDWVVQNYVDLDRSSGLRDYRGVTGKSARTYNQHNGIDIDVPTFKWTDNGFPVLAAANGIVTALQQRHPDRNLERNSGGFGNFVQLTHPNGFITIYAHLKQNSITVAPGEEVKQGQKLGVIASSGNSTWPHLHFEVRNCEGQPVSSALERLWENAPAYEIPFSVWELVIRKGKPPKSSKRFIISGKENAKTFTSGQYITISPLIAGGLEGDSIEVEITYKDGRLYENFRKVFKRNHGKSFWFWYFKLPKPYSGSMYINVKLNGRIEKTDAIEIKP